MATKNPRLALEGTVIKAEATALGDVVRLALDSEISAPFNSCTVINKLPNGDVTLYRPYVHTADFSYTGGVIPYIGAETFNVYATNTLRLLKAGEALK